MSQSSGRAQSPAETTGGRRKSPRKSPSSCEPEAESPRTAKSPRTSQRQTSPPNRWEAGVEEPECALGKPMIVPPTAEHTHTMFLLHGFTANGEDLHRRWMSGLNKQMSDRLANVKFIFLNAPTRAISCYGKASRPRHQAWHDYFTDHGGEDGLPDLEEEIDARHLAQARTAVRRRVMAEIEALGGDPRRVALGGHSQGGCTAYDVALSLPVTIGGLFASRCHLYSCSGPGAPHS